MTCRNLMLIPEAAPVAPQSVVTDGGGPLTRDYMCVDCIN